MASTNTKTTVKIAALTGAAKDDVFAVAEDSAGSVKLAVLANDPGAAKLYSVWQPTGSTGAIPATSSQLPVINSTTLPSGATIAMNADGTITYAAGDVFQHLGANDKATDTFSYTVRMANGALSTATVTVQVTGENDPAAISGIAEGRVTEDGTLTVGDILSVTDVDDGETGFKPVDESALTGAYGSFTFDNGAWTFTGDNAAAQHLGANDTATQTLTVTSLDGTATQDIVVTIEGVNDPAAIGGNAEGTVTEDGTLTAGGILSVTDVDDGEAGFQVVDESTFTGIYGDFTFDASNGTWGYNLRNSDVNVQALNTTDVFYDTLTVKSLDGTTKEIKVQVNGADEPISVNSPSVLQADSKSTAEDTVANDNVLSNDYDADDILTVSSFQIGSNNYPAGASATIADQGTLVMNADGGYTFTPVKNWNGSVQQISYTTNTGSTSTLDITVTPVSDNFLVNYGNQQSLHQTLYGFHSDDKLTHSNNVKYDHYADGPVSDVVYYKVVQGNATGTLIDVTLVGFNAFDASTNLAA